MDTTAYPFREPDPQDEWLREITGRKLRRLHAIEATAREVHEASKHIIVRGRSPEKVTGMNAALNDLRGALDTTPQGE